MRLIIVLISLLTISAFNANSQDLLYKKYDWAKNPSPEKVDLSDTSDLEIVIFEKRAVEFNFDPKSGELFEYYLFHQRVKVVSDDAIEKNNKIYLPLNSSTEVLSLKARTISPEGKIKEHGISDVIESKDEKTNRTMKYFALEGVEKGSEIEQLIMLKRSPRITGNGYTFQGSVKKMKIEFELITPKFLPFRIKSLNGFPDMEVDSTVNDRILYKASFKDMPILKDEKFASYDPHKMGVIFKLHANKNTGATNLFNFSKVCETIYQNVYADYDKGKKSVAKFVKKIGLKPEDSELDKIHKVENYVKANTLILDIDIPAWSEVKSILSSSITLDNKKKKMIASNVGIMRVFAYVYTFLGIDHQVVMTCDRYDKFFDREFESYHYLDEYLIYFPNQDMLISPCENYSRSKFISQGCYNTYALFIVPVTVGTMKSAISKVKFIEALPETANTDSLYLNCSLNIASSKLAINYRRTALGYYAIQYQPFYDLLDKETLTEFEKVFTAFLTSNKEDVKKFKIDNVGVDNVGKPLITEAELECEKFVEMAGDKYVVKLGELIGPQAELYQEGERKLPVENGFNRLYYRRIEFVVPDGYKIADASKLKMDFKHTNDKGKVTMEFKSEYKLQGNKLIVDCTEYYRQISYPVELFEEFRKVINAAADFNKIAIVLEKS